MIESPMISMTNIHHKKDDDDDDQQQGDVQEEDESRTSFMGVLNKWTEVGPNNESEYKPKFKVERTDIHKILKERCFFDAIGTQFHLLVFLQQLFCHVLFPLMIFLPNPAAQGVRYNWFGFYYTLLHPVVFYTMIGTYFFMDAADQKLLGYSVLLPMVFFLSHRCTVALKYATLSNTEYERFNKCKDLSLVDCYIFQLQLLSGWLNLDSLVLYFELGAASSRIGVKINNLYMKLDPDLTKKQALSQYRYWNAFLRGHELIDTDSKPAPEIKKLPSGELGISVFDICVAIIRKANRIEELSNTATQILTLLTISMIIALYVPVFRRPSEVQHPVLVTFYLLSASFMFWTYGRTFFFFLYVTIVDVGRFLQMVKILHCMTRLTDLMMHSTLTIGNSKVNQCDDRMSKSRIDAILSACESTYADYSLYDMELKEEMEQSEISMPICGEEDALLKASDTQQSMMESGVRDSEAGVVGEKFAENLKLAMTPRINFLQPDNATAWIYARLAIQHFGERFRYRTDIYTACTLILMLLMMIVILVSIVLTGDRHSAYTTVIFYQSMITVTLIVIFLLIIFDLGAKANDELIMQTKTLALHSARIKTRLNRFNNDDPNQSHFYSEESLENALDGVDQAKDIAEIHNELKPYKILGMPAQSALTASVLSTAISFYTVIFSLYNSDVSSLSDAAAIAGF